MPPANSVVTATIDADQSLSDGVDLSGGNVIHIVMPDDWTPANVTFLVSPDGVAYSDLFDQFSNEATMAVVLGAAVVFRGDVASEAAAAWIKLRSGSRQFPVKQKASRQFKFVLTPRS